MAAQNIAADVELWVADEIVKTCFGEDFGFAVTWGPAQVPDGQGGARLAPGWQLLMTARDPLLGRPDMVHMVSLGLGRPKEADVRAQAAEGVRQLRDLAKSQTAAGNGRAHALPG